MMLMTGYCTYDDMRKSENVGSRTTNTDETGTEERLRSELNVSSEKGHKEEIPLKKFKEKVEPVVKREERSRRK